MAASLSWSECAAPKPFFASLLRSMAASFYLPAVSSWAWSPFVHICHVHGANAGEQLNGECLRGLKHADKQWRRVVMGPVLGVEAQGVF
eukprot:scaffold293929_cov22-Tisochrysis_lutea.AAC.1